MTAWRSAAAARRASTSPRVAFESVLSHMPWAAMPARAKSTSAFGSPDLSSYSTSQIGTDRSPATISPRSKAISTRLQPDPTSRKRRFTWLTRTATSAAGTGSSPFSVDCRSAPARVPTCSEGSMAGPRRGPSDPAWAAPPRADRRHAGRVPSRSAPTDRGFFAGAATSRPRRADRQRCRSSATRSPPAERRAADDSPRSQAKRPRARRTSARSRSSSPILPTGRRPRRARAVAKPPMAGCDRAGRMRRIKDNDRRRAWR